MQQMRAWGILVRVEELELLGALLEVVSQGDAVTPALDLTALGPEFEVYRVSCLEHPVKGADVDELRYRSIGMRGQTARRRCGR